jgi:hypothetical protein
VEPGQGNQARHDASLVEVTRTDVQARPGAVELDAEQPIPPEFWGQDTVIINNPRGYRVDIANIGQAVRPGGRIVIQGRAEVTPGMRGINRDMNPILQQVLEGDLPPGYRVVDVTVLPDVRGGDPTAVQKPVTIMGGPFQRTTGGPVGWPNTQIIVERIVPANEPVARPSGRGGDGGGEGSGGGPTLPSTDPTHVPPPKAGEEGEFKGDPEGKTSGRRDPGSKGTSTIEEGQSAGERTTTAGRGSGEYRRLGEDPDIGVLEVRADGSVSIVSANRQDDIEPGVKVATHINLANHPNGLGPITLGAARYRFYLKNGKVIHVEPLGRAPQTPERVGEIERALKRNRLVSDQGTIINLAPEGQDDTLKKTVF